MKKLMIALTALVIGFSPIEAVSQPTQIPSAPHIVICFPIDALEGIMKKSGMTKFMMGNDENVPTIFWRNQETKTMIVTALKERGGNYSACILTIIEDVREFGPLKS